MILSLIFVHVFPENLKVVGVIVATIITTLLICDIVDPYVVFKHVFEKSVKGFWLRNYIYIVVFTLSLFIMSVCTIKTASDVSGIILNGLMSVVLSVVVLGIIAVFDKAFRSEMLYIRWQAVGWLKRRQS